MLLCVRRRVLPYAILYFTSIILGPVDLLGMGIFLNVGLKSFDNVVDLISVQGSLFLEFNCILILLA